MRAQRRVGLHARARLRDEIVHRHVDFGHAVHERLVRGRRKPAPGRQRREQALRQRREDPIEVALDDVLVRAERVHLRAEGQPGDGVHGVAHQVGLQVYRGVAARGLLPARHQPQRHALQRREVALDVGRIEAGHHHAALALPVFTGRTEDAADQAHFRPHLLEAGGASKAVGAIAQRGRDQGVVAHHHDPAAAEPQLEHGPEGFAPLLQLQVHARGIDLQQVAEDRHPARAGQVVELAQCRWRRGGDG